MSLGELLKELRGDEGLRDAAKRIEITYSSLAMLEKGIDRRTGKPLKPTSETLLKIAHAYKYNYMKLIEVASYLHDEKDIEKLKTIWDVIHESGDN